MSTLLSTLRASLAATLLLTLICGVGYPLLITGAAQVLNPTAAEGSQIKNAKGQIIGSSLIGQAFTKPQYLQPRPSAAGNGYDATASGGSNLGPLAEGLKTRIAADAKTWKANAVGAPTADALTASGSGLDPHISPLNAQAQAKRIAAARRIDVTIVRAVIASHVEGPDFGLFGAQRVNVLKTNLDLDAKYPVR